MELSDDDVRRAWAQASGLTRSDTDRPLPAAVVAAAGGIQAQDRRAARLSVWARARHLDAAAIEDALVGDRSVVRTWAMRGTFHLVAIEDVGWLLALLGPVFIAAARRRYRELGLDEEACATAVAAIGAAVAAEGPLTRPVLAQRLRARGVDVEPGSQALAHLVRRAAMEAVICCGPDDGGGETYVAWDAWVGDRAARGPTGDAALAELARRHLGAFGPARPEDFATWSGLSVSRARTAWRLLDGELADVAVGGRPAWVLEGTDLGRGDAGRPSVRLLPAFDTYLLGHKGRELIVEESFASRVWPGGGWIHPTVVVDGEVVGTWKLASRGGSTAGLRGPNATEVAVDPFTVPAADVGGALEAEVDRLRTFLGAP